MKIEIAKVSGLKMSVNPPKEVVDAGYRVIYEGKVKSWVGRGWVTDRVATKEDYETIPEVE